MITTINLNLTVYMIGSWEVPKLILIGLFSEVSLFPQGYPSCWQNDTLQPSFLCFKVYSIVSIFPDLLASAEISLRVAVLCLMWDRRDGLVGNLK